MQKYVNWVTDTLGNVVGGASVTVYTYGTSTKATIYSDNGTTPVSNPLTTDSADGSFAFYAANARYTLAISKTGFTFDSADTTDVVLFDQADGLKVASGSASAPGVAFASETNTGFYRTSADTTWWSDQGSTRFGLSSGSVRMASDSTLLWTDTAGDSTASGDSSLSRLGAARLALGNGSAGNTAGQLDQIGRAHV